MKRKLSYFLMSAVLAFFVISCGSDSNEKTTEGTTGKTEETADDKTSNETFTEQDYNLPKEVSVNSDNEEVISDKFYPIGWSEDGKFAYIIEPVDEATGYYFINIAIQDMNSDKIVWNFKYTTEDAVEGKDLAETWKEKYDLIKEKLNEHKIVQAKKIKLGPSDFENNSDTFSIAVNSEKEVKEELHGMQIIKNFAVTISSSALGSKKIFSENDENSMLVDAKIEGQIKSPYQNKVAVVLTKEQVGYEGPPNTVSINLVGANLESGFKK